MTVESMDCRARYATDGVQKTFPVVFRFLRAEDLGVYWAENSQIENVKYELNKDYTVVGDGSFENGGTVIFATAPPEGRLAIRREIPYTQESNYTPNGDIPAETMEGNLDKAVMLIQQLKEELERCIKVAIASGESPEALLKSIFMAKDSALTAAQASANSAENSAAIYAQMAWIWTEITGDDTLFEKAFITAKEAAEATGAIDTAAEAAKAGINEASQAALNHALAEVKEAKESSLDALTTATGSANASIDLKISEAIGADGTLTVMKTAAEQALADAKANSESIQASMTAAKDVVDSAVAGALQRAEEAVDRGEQVEQSVLTALQQAQNAASSASGSATSALQQAQAAADAKVAAESAKAAAEAAAGEAGSLVNSSVTAHNSNASAHTAIQNKFASYLPLAGGTMTGVINRNGVLAGNPTNGGFVALRGGTSTYNNGGALILYDKGYADNEGHFLLQAGDGTNVKGLRGKPDGTLVWGNYNVLRDYFSRADNTGTIQLFSGTGYTTCGFLQLYGALHSENPGGFKLGAADGTNVHALIGKPDGQLLWDNKSILNDMAHSTSANGYVKLTNGLIIQWGRGNSVNGETSVETQFPITFPTACLRVVASPFCSNANASVDGWIQVMSYDTSKFKYFGQYSGDVGGIACDYIAIGY